MSTYKTWIEVEVTVHYDYQPEDKQVLYPNDEAHPGCDASVTLNAVELYGSPDLPLDILDHLDGGDQQSLIDEIMEHLTTGDEE